MKITPDENNIEETTEVESIQGIRERIQRFTQHDVLSACVLSIARENNMTSQDAMVLLAYHALMKIEALEEVIAKMTVTPPVIVTPVDEGVN